MFKFIITLLCLTLLIKAKVPQLNSFEDLAKYHCKATDLPLLYQIASGNLAQFYGPKFKEYDAYIRTFVGQDFYYREDDNDDSDQQEQNPYKQDQVVVEYVKGLNDCGLNWSQKQVYQIWRFIRYILNSDYLFEWLRAKMRISYGYQIQKPNAWMDGQQKEDRLRLQKLYSNEYLDSLEDLMHRDFLYPLVTTLRKNIVLAASGTYTKSGKPVLINVIEARNYPSKIFFPVQIKLDGQQFFSFTIPGLPLLLSGSSKNVAWAFSGILVDRTNVQQIETTGMRFFDEDNQRWVKIRKVEESIKVKGEPDHNITYHWSKEGPLVNKSSSKTKIKQYIVKWHQDQPRVRTLFSELATFIKNPTSRPILHFPFNSLVTVDGKGIHHQVCPPVFPYYFLYPDMLGQPQNFEGKQLWSSNPKKGFFIVSNTRLSSVKPLGYLDKQLFNTDQQALALLLKDWKDTKKDLFSMVNEVTTSYETINAKKIVNNLLTIYRKAKFTYLPDQTIRNENDQLVALLDKWDYKITHPKLGAIYRMWLYFLKMNTFGHSARSPYAKDIARFKLSTDTYFAGQTELWKGVASYGECNIDEYNDRIQQHVNHTTHNSSCYYNILKSINQTRQFFIREGGDLLNTDSNYYNQKKAWNPLKQDYWKKVGHGDTAFLTTFKQKLILGSELGSQIIYSSNGLNNLKSFYFGYQGDESEDEYKDWHSQHISTYVPQEQKQKQYLDDQL